MASAFGHALAAITIGTSYPKRMINWKFWVFAVICSILPDADVVGFKLGIPYEAFWGHRGFTHSLLFAFITGILVTSIFFSKQHSFVTMIRYAAFFTLCTASHGLLDAMTSDGLGVAFFSPWDNERHFLPWQPIQVSPIGIASFFSEWGKKVIISELLWIGLPCLVYMSIIRLIRKR